MRFEWDEAKRRRVIAEPVVDLRVAARIFESWTLDRIDDRADYGEIRVISVGMVRTECYIVVHTARDGAIRLITAWKGGERDEQRYTFGFARRTAPHG